MHSCCDSGFWVLQAAALDIDPNRKSEPTARFCYILNYCNPHITMMLMHRLCGNSSRLLNFIPVNDHFFIIFYSMKYWQIILILPEHYCIGCVCYDDMRVVAAEELQKSTVDFVGCVRDWAQCLVVCLW